VHCSAVGKTRVGLAGQIRFPVAKPLSRPPRRHCFKVVWCVAARPLPKRRHLKSLPAVCATCQQWMPMNQPPPPRRGIYLCPKCRKPLRRRDDLVPLRWECSAAPVCAYTQPDDCGHPAPPDEARSVAGSAIARPAANTSPRSSKPGRIGERCPDCGTGLLVQKTLKSNGKPFIGCNRFPRCRFFKWLGG
jgi:ssDNA-binding Zn-finger/Zn-ribbon topoisomerase 1